MLHTSLTDPLTEPPITYPTRRLRGIFLQKNNSIIATDRDVTGPTEQVQIMFPLKDKDIN